MVAAEPAAITTSAVEAGPASMEATTTMEATVTAAMLGETRSCKHEAKGSDSCEKSLRQSGFLHLNPSTWREVGGAPHRRLRTRESKPPLANPDL